MELLIIIFLFCISTSSLCIFLHDCMEPGMIFRKYYLWLTYLWIKNWRKKDRWKRPWLKIFGMCIYCNSVYIGSILLYIFNLIYLKFDITHFLFTWPLFIGVQHNTIKLLLKLK